MGDFAGRILSSKGKSTWRRSRQSKSTISHGAILGSPLSGTVPVDKPRLIGGQRVFSRLLGSVLEVNLRNDVCLHRPDLTSVLSPTHLLLGLPAQFEACDRNLDPFRRKRERTRQGARG